VISRKKNQRSWFRVDTGAQTLEGVKMVDGNLLLTIKFMGEFSSIKVSPQNADKIVDWLMKCYPRRNNVIRLETKLSLYRTETDPEGSPPGPGR
jgi:hypothetical protein